MKYEQICHECPWWICLEVVLYKLPSTVTITNMHLSTQRCSRLQHCYFVGVNMPKRCRQLWVKDLPKVPTWRLEQDSNPRPFGRKASTLPMGRHAPRVHSWTEHLMNCLVLGARICWILATRSITYQVVPLRTRLELLRSVTNVLSIVMFRSLFQP